MSRLGNLFATAFALAITVTCAVSVPPPPAESPVVAFSKDPAALKRGRGLFIGMCGAYCHSFHGGPRGDVPDLFDCTWKYGGSDDEIFRSISNGAKGTRMIGFKGILPHGDTDIWKLVAFLRVQSDCGKK